MPRAPGVVQCFKMLYQLAIPFFLLFMPWVVVRFVLATPASRQVRYRRAAPYLALAAVLWFVGFALPGVSLFGGATTTFILHTIGGVIAAVLFWFVTYAYQLSWKQWWQEPLALYAFACALGVLNELFEFFLYQTKFFDDPGADTWWDLTANTLGAALAFAAVLVLRRMRVSG